MLSSGGLPGGFLKITNTFVSRFVRPLSWQSQAELD